MNQAVAVIDFNGDLGTPELLQPDPAKVIFGNPEQRVWNLHADESGQFFAGVWECSVGAWEVAYTEHEYCRILSGKVELRDAAGRTRTYGAGDAFIIPAGFAGTWATLEPCRKQYVIFEASRN
jgi:uncharacterized cupin superfamily protein